MCHVLKVSLFLFGFPKFGGLCIFLMFTTWFVYHGVCAVPKSAFR